MDTACTTRTVTTNGVRLHVPTLIVWGTQDVVLGRDLVPASLELCDQARAVYLDGATHWLIHEEPEAVAGLLVEHFQG